MRNKKEFYNRSKNEISLRRNEEDWVQLTDGIDTACLSKPDGDVANSFLNSKFKFHACPQFAGKPVRLEVKF